MSSKHCCLLFLLTIFLSFSAVPGLTSEHLHLSEGHSPLGSTTAHLNSNTNNNANNNNNNNNAYLYGVFELYTKLDTVMKLIENGFGRTNERVDMMEQKLGRLELTLSQLDRQLKTVHTSTQYVADRFEKIYNVHTETYTICKEAVINLEKGAVGGILKGSKQTKQISRANLHQDIVVENGDRRFDSGGGARSHATKETAAGDETEEEDNILYVISAVANLTAQRFYNRIERKVDEEFNAIDFQLRNELIASVTNLSATTEHLIKGSDKVLFGILDMRDRLADEQTMISQMESKLANKFEQLKNLNENAKDDKVVVDDSTACKCSVADKNLLAVEEKLRMLLEDYFGSSNLTKTNEIDHSGEATKQISLARERTGKDSKTSTFRQPAKPKVYPTAVKSTTEKPAAAERPTTKPPLNFVTISMGQNVHSPRWDYPTVTGTSTTSTNQITSNASQTEMILKPEFRPAKLSSNLAQGCTAKSSVSYPKSCAELRVHGATCDSVYVIILRKFSLKHVYCDQRHLLGGWTVLLRRGRFGSHTKQITFDHTYPAYRSGFGDMHLGEFFLGLDTIHQLTSEEEGPQVLQVDLEDTEGEVVSLQFDGFRVGGLADDFRLYVDGVRGVGGGGEGGDWGTVQSPHHHHHQLAAALLAHNGSAFLTADRVRRQLESTAKESTSPPNAELSLAGDCAQAFQAGWWYGGSGSGSGSLPFGLTKSDACRMTNAVQLMAPLDRFRSGSKSNAGGGGGSGFRTTPTQQYFNYQSTALAQQQHSPGWRQPPAEGAPLTMYWSKWTRSDGSPRVLKYVLMKMRPANFRLKQAPKLETAL